MTAIDIHDELTKMGFSLASLICKGKNREGRWEFIEYEYAINYKDGLFFKGNYKAGIGCHDGKIVGITNKEILTDIMNCLLTDYNNGLMTLEDFCSEYDISPNLRENKITHSNSVRVARAFYIFRNRMEIFYNLFQDY